MVKVCHCKPREDILDRPALALFRRQWELYRKLVDNNYLFHREAYGLLGIPVARMIMFTFIYMLRSRRTCWDSGRTYLVCLGRHGFFDRPEGLCCQHCGRVR